MKIRVKMLKKVVLLMLSVIFIMGMTACSVESREGMTDLGVVEPKVVGEENTKTETTETEVVKDAGKEDSVTEEIIEGDPIVAMVDRYEDNIIVLRDLDDEDIIYYFFTQGAQVVEGDSPIAAGDVVEITYRGVQGDEEHPGEAVKVVAESMMYK